MKDLNKIILIGRLGTHPIRRETKTGTPVTHFSLATSRRISDEANGGEGAYREETVWHDIVVWGRQAEACAQYLRKGNTVFVEGSVKKRPYTSKDGTQKISFEVQSETVGFLPGGSSSRSSESETLAEDPVEAAVG